MVEGGENRGEGGGDRVEGEGIRWRVEGIRWRVEGIGWRGEGIGWRGEGIRWRGEGRTLQPDTMAGDSFPSHMTMSHHWNQQEHDSSVPSHSIIHTL